MNAWLWGSKLQWSGGLHKLCQPHPPGLRMTHRGLGRRALPPSLETRKYPPPQCTELWSEMPRLECCRESFKLFLTFHFQATPGEAALSRCEPLHRDFSPCGLPETAFRLEVEGRIRSSPAKAPKLRPWRPLLAALPPLPELRFSTLLRAFLGGFWGEGSPGPQGSLGGWHLIGLGLKGLLPSFFTALWSSWG